MVQVRQLESEQKVKLESAAGRSQFGSDLIQFLHTYPNSSADEPLSRRGPRGRRTSGIGECVRIPTTNEHSSKGAGDVSGEAPPMLKSAVHENERMGKAELVKAMQEEARASGEVGPPKKAVKKRPAASSAEEEAHREKRAKKKGASTSGTRPGEDPKMTHEPTPPTRTSEETPDQPPVITILEASSPARGKGPERALPLDFSKDSLVDSPTGVVATKQWLGGGEVVKRLTRAHRTVKASRKKFDEAMGRHAEMVARLEELEVLRAQDEVVAVTQRKELEAELAAEKEARAAEKRALGAELERANARAERVKEDFLKSPEFDSLLVKKAWGYFKDGFWGCLAQFRSNGNSEEEHPASFLNLQQALENLGDYDDAEDEEEEQEEGEVGDDTEANTPNSPKP
ncbi:hypothetical protein F511_34125 [Dorcoceras hygrometricum]|uniref:Uncharacterized protein n=1 Tax=Dorcoceras hygrometricum TaxID=472368 RepID=A0A2Z7AS63_9LAMI|nr:hypothetical protein F511_34125 [Dorcoceras hygrometricum]